MPRSSQKLCAYPACGALTRSRFCSKHIKVEVKRKAAGDRLRPNSYQRGYDRQWRNARKFFLIGYPVCVHCLAKGIDRLAQVVDHIVPHKGCKVLFWNRKNWQSLCKQCHDRKTATEDGGFAMRKSDH